MHRTPKDLEREDHRPTETYRAAGRPYLSNLYRGKRRLSSRARFTIVFLLVLIALLVADAAYTIRGLRAPLEAAASDLRAGATAVEAGDLRKAQLAFLQAEEEIQEARSFTNRPTLTAASWLPWVGDDAHALRGLVDVIDLVDQAGITAVQGGAALGGTSGEQLARALFTEGRVQLENLEQGEVFVTEVDQLLGRAERILDDLPDPHTETLDDAVDEARAEISSAREITDKGLTLLGTIPTMLGRDQDRRYLLAFQSPSEARGTGGNIGVYGILEATNGQIALTRVDIFTRLFANLDPATLAEVTGKRGLQRFSTLEQAGDVNRSPDFPAVAEVLLRLFEEQTGERLDGVWMSDPVSFGHLTRATGPLKGDGLDVEVGPDNAADVLLHDYYVAFEGDPTGQDRFLLSLIKKFYAALGRGTVDGPTVIDSFGKATSSQHLKIYSRHPEEEAALKDLGVSGTYTEAGPNLQFIWHNNLGRNKVDYFLRRSVETTVRFTAGGYGQITTAIQLANNAPKGVDAAFLRSYTGAVAPGVNWMQLNAILPGAAARVAWRIDGQRVETTESVEGDFLVSRSTLKIPPQERASVTISYELSNATDVLTGGNFAMSLFPQATAVPDRFRLRFVPPVGLQITSAEGGKSLPGGELEFSGVLDRQKNFEIEIAPL